MERLFSSGIMNFIVYILQSLVTHRFYVGQTYDLEKRLAEHNRELAGYTKSDQPWQVNPIRELRRNTSYLQQELIVVTRNYSLSLFG